MVTSSILPRAAAPQASWIHDTTEDHDALVSQPQDGVAVLASGTYAWNGLDKLEGVDAATGQAAWTVEHAYYPGLPPTVGPDGKLYSQSYDGSAILVRDPKTGAALKQTPESFTMYSGLSAGTSGNIYVGGATETYQGIFAVNKDTGAEKWHYPMHYLTGIAPVEINGRVYCEDGSRLTALDSSHGQAAVVFCRGHRVFPPIAGPDGTLYIIDRNDTVYALDPKQGKPDGSTPSVWTNHLDVPIQNPDGVTNLDVSEPLLLTHDGLVAVTNNQTVRQIDPKTGKQNWEVKEPVDGGPASARPDGSILVGDGNGVLLIDGKGNTSRWDATGNVTAPSGAPASTVVQYGVGKVAGF